MTPRFVSSRASLASIPKVSGYSAHRFCKVSADTGCDNRNSFAHQYLRFPAREFACLADVVCKTVIATFGFRNLHLRVNDPHDFAQVDKVLLTPTTTDLLPENLSLL